MKIDADLDLLPIDGERLTASRFLELVKNNPGLIKRSRIVLPKLGEDGFGSFDVVYSRPIYKTSVAPSAAALTISLQSSVKRVTSYP